MIALVLMLCAFSVGTSEFAIVGVLPEVAADLPVARRLVTAYAVAPVLAALAQGLFLSAAVAKVVNAVAALSTVLGVPAGTLVGQAYGWRASFVLVTALTAIGPIGVLVACPRVAHEPEPSVRESTFAFTYVTSPLREVTGLSPE